MRMFLVGMCDVFLLLYLTALAQIDARKVSDLTVKDYVALETTSKELAQRTEKLERDATAKESDLLARDREVERLKRELAQLQQRSASLDAAANQKEEALRRISQDQRQALERAKTLEEEKSKLEASAQARARALEDEVRKREAALLQARADAERQSAIARDLEQAAKAERAAAERGREDAARAQRAREEEAQRAKQAEEEAEKARTLAAAAEERARSAADRQREAQAAEQSARQAQEEALKYAERAVARFEGAHDLASRALSTAKEASNERSEARGQLQSVMRSAQGAYTNLVRGKLVPIDVTAATAGLLGSRTNTIHLSLYPVQYLSERVAFVPLSQLKSESDRVDLTAASAGGTIRKVYLSPDPDPIAALVLPDAGPAANLLEAKNPRELMPTLMAVRNGAARDTRGAAEAHYFFSRDRLLPGGSVFFYLRSGRRTRNR